MNADEITKQKRLLKLKEKLSRICVSKGCSLRDVVFSDQVLYEAPDQPGFSWGGTGRKPTWYRTLEDRGDDMMQYARLKEPSEILTPKAEKDWMD